MQSMNPEPDTVSADEPLNKKPVELKRGGVRGVPNKSQWAQGFKASGTPDMASKNAASGSATPESTPLWQPEHLWVTKRTNGLPVPELSEGTSTSKPTSTKVGKEQGASPRPITVVASQFPPRETPKRSIWGELGKRIAQGGGQQATISAYLENEWFQHPGFDCEPQVRPLMGGNAAKRLFPIPMNAVKPSWSQSYVRRALFQVNGSDCTFQATMEKVREIWVSKDFEKTSDRNVTQPKRSMSHIPVLPSGGSGHYFNVVYPRKLGAKKRWVKACEVINVDEAKNVAKEESGSHAPSDADESAFVRVNCWLMPDGSLARLVNAGFCATRRDIVNLDGQDAVDEIRLTTMLNAVPSRTAPTYGKPPPSPHQSITSISLRSLSSASAKNSPSASSSSPGLGGQEACVSSGEETTSLAKSLVPEKAIPQTHSGRSTLRPRSNNGSSRNSPTIPPRTAILSNRCEEYGTDTAKEAEGMIRAGALKVGHSHGKENAVVDRSDFPQF
ncbi:hypothetical protein BD410DRAFT_854699 [Rickenella mellea]|uniref:Uncharacterized protein n=1 Tax=Rickenella mellea TaxID=50990 RepID=A0A4Y7PJZ6_9AGAM|nr:hypothetical protein BD410DRAFT_854699 [Rickenella mellea]